MFQTAAALTADYGDIQGAALFGGAIRDSARLGTLSMREKSVLDRALRDGVIDQGFGYFMSGLANAGNLRRRVRKSRIGKFTRGFVDAGMYPFKAVEYANRRVTMLAFYRAEYKKALQGGKTLIAADATAYAIALQRTRLLQNDYASGNRPPILTGRKSIAMIFLSYPQYMLWILGGGYERGTRAESRLRGEDPRSWVGGTTMRMWLIFLAFAGVEGVPFGEMIIDIAQLMWKKFGTGENLRVEAQRMMKEQLGIDPYWRNVIQRGLFHNIGGVDLSGSYSLGTPLPGTGLFDPHANTWREFIGEAFEEFTGPFGGAIKGGVGLAVEDKDIGLKQLGQNLPAAAGSVARAATMATEGLVTSRGDRILKDEEGDFRDPTTGEILATGAGFRLTEVAEFQQLRNLKRQQADHWSARRLQIKRQFKEGYKDPKTRSEMIEVIRKFNAEVPFGGLRIGGKELSDFLKRDITRIRKLEKGIDKARNYRLEQDIEQVYEGKR
jgi:hypothetical protein